MANRWRQIFPKAIRGEAAYHVGGEAYFAAIANAIDSTRGPGDFICILGWMIDIDLPLKRGSWLETLSFRLAAAAGRGVEVAILVWDNWLSDYAALTRAAEDRFDNIANIHMFKAAQPYFPAASRKTVAQVRPRLLQLLNRNAKLLMALQDQVGGMTGGDLIMRAIELLNGGSLAAHHEKVVVVGREGRLDAWCGGIDFNRNRISGSSRDTTISWVPSQHDIAVHVDGQAAHAILQRFLRRWAAHGPSSKVKLVAASAAQPAASPAGNWVLPVGTWNSPDGKTKERSFAEAFTKIIDNAREHILIEDQYLVNVQVAQALGKKMLDPQFQKLTLVMQDSQATSDILIPNRKRGEFLEALLGNEFREAALGTGTGGIAGKFALLAPNRKQAKKDKFPTGVHAKVMIADDEIALVGSGNVNRRSFTLDSETGLVVFDEAEGYARDGAGNFARRLRIAIWETWLKPHMKGLASNWYAIGDSVRTAPNWTDACNLERYTSDNADDADTAVARAAKEYATVLIMLGPQFGLDDQEILAAFSEHAMKNLFDEIWLNFIDPDGS